MDTLDPVEARDLIRLHGESGAAALLDVSVRDLREQLAAVHLVHLPRLIGSRRQVAELLGTFPAGRTVLVDARDCLSASPTAARELVGIVVIEQRGRLVLDHAPPEFAHYVCDAATDYALRDRVTIHHREVLPGLEVPPPPAHGRFEPWEVFALLTLGGLILIVYALAIEYIAGRA